MINSVRPEDGKVDRATTSSAGQLPTPSPSVSSELAKSLPAAVQFDEVEADEDTITPEAKQQPHASSDHYFSKGRHELNSDVQRVRASTLSPGSISRDAVLKLSPQQIKDLTSEPRSLPFKPATPIDEDVPSLDGASAVLQASNGRPHTPLSSDGEPSAHKSFMFPLPNSSNAQAIGEVGESGRSTAISPVSRPNKAKRSASSPMFQRKSSSNRSGSRPQVPPLNIDKRNLDDDANGKLNPSGKHDTPGISPLPSLPIPPLSLPTYLQLELSSEKPSPLYIHQGRGDEFPYESAQVKFDRLLNFFRLPPELEQVLWFGALACLDSWLYTFTILPLRFLQATWILVQWTCEDAAKEVLDLSTFVFEGVGRVWQRRRESVSGSRRPYLSDSHDIRRPSMSSRSTSAQNTNGHISLPSTTEKPRPNHKADILQGLLIILSCVVLMWFDASRMYHSIRGQAAIKLYVIYNVLEVFDRLFSALGQDVLECLFSKETLERNANGRSKIVRPLWMFALALVYNITHAAALFYQVVTLNVAVNSYSNALLTLLMSNQFVEIKGTVFKKFEKENLFQLTCADVVERFQLWLMLSIIALRNIVEVGGLNISLNSSSSTPSATAGAAANATSLPTSGGGLLPNAFTLIPYWTGEVIGPFLIVLGSEMLVDWLKHAYITKFNNIKPNVYGRFLDVLAKDYYSHAFAEQNLTKRLGLPVIPLSCLFIRASMQTYHMFLATHVPIPMPSPATAVSLENDTIVTTPATMKALEHIDHIFRRALGRSSFGAGNDQSAGAFSWWSLDDVIAFTTMAIFFLALYFLLLAFKLILGMLLLSYARNRYRSMREREHQSSEARGKRVGGWGVVDVSDDKRRWIYDDDPDGLRDLQARDAKAKAKGEKGDLNLDRVDRYIMAAKRIW